MEDGLRIGQGVIAGVIAKRAFVTERLGGVIVAFDDEVGVGQNIFNSGKMFSRLGQLGETNLNWDERAKGNAERTG